MRRLKWFISVALILISGWCIEQASAKAAAPAWMTAYEEILSRWKSQTPEDPDMVQELHYLVYDIDKDGTPEMIVRSGTCEADYHGALYTIRNGQAVQMGEELGLGHCSFYSDPEENGIIMMWAHMGYSSAVRISLTDGYSEELLYEDDLNARLQENPDADYVGAIAALETAGVKVVGDFDSSLLKARDESRVLADERISGHLCRAAQGHPVVLHDLRHKHPAHASSRTLYSHSYHFQNSLYNELIRF